MSAVAERLRSVFTGDLVEPGDPAYDGARGVWNAMIDRHPALIARCRTTRDVATAVTFARDQGLEVAVRCGGHGVAGHSVCDGGLVVDLGLMRAVNVDAERRTASVQGGALLGDVDRAAQQVGLVTPAGVVSHTGVGGLTLGGGFGWLSRLHGLTCDNLIGAEVVTATGDVITAGENEDAELLWALRGGGGNFGVVTRFDFQLHPLDGRVWTTTIAYAPAAAEAALSALAEVAAQAPRELTLAAWIGAGRASPFLPAEWQGRAVLVVAAVFIGAADAGESAVGPLQAVPSIGAATAETTYLDLQRSADEGAAHGLRRYWKGHFLPALGGAVRTAFLEEGLRLAEESPNTGFELFALGGAARDAPVGGSAFAHRDAEWDCIASARWSDPGDDEREIGAARRAGEAMAPYARGVYANDLADEGAGRVRDAYGETYERLVRVKDRLDPENVFRRNQNVRPSGAR